jgi:hypothetical protein
MVRILIYPLGGGLPQLIDIEGPDALADALVLDLRPTDAENVLKGGATEYSFDAPQTPSNRLIFDDWQNYQRDAGTAYLYRDAVLEVDGFPARLGKLALMSTTNEVARLTMFFDSEDPFRNLQDLRVNELDWDVVEDTGFQMLNYGGWFYKRIFDGTANVVTIPAKLRSWPVDGNGDRVVTNADYYPCISIRDLFYQAFQRTTPTAPASIDYDAQWTAAANFENLVIFLNKNNNYDKEYLRRIYGVYAGGIDVPFVISSAPAISVLYPVNNDSTDGFYDNNSNFTLIGGALGTRRYTAPYNGIYNFEIVIKTDIINVPGATNTNIYTRFDLNGVAGTLQISQALFNGNAYTFTFTHSSISMSAGDTMDFKFDAIAVGVLLPIPVTNYIRSIELFIEIAEDAYSAGSSPMLTGAWVPSNLSVADVMRDVFRMFNLRMFWDNVRQRLSIAPARRWYNQLDSQTYSGFMAQPEVDWTDRVVEPPQEVIVERWAWDYWTVYGEPADAWLKKQSALSEVPSAGGRINAGFYGSQRNVTEMEGAALAHIFDKTVSNTAYPTVMLPMLLSQNHEADPVGQTSFNTDNTLFYLQVSDVQTSANYGELRIYNIPTGATAFAASVIASQIPYDYNSTINDFVRPSLAFGDEVSKNGDPIPGLLSNYHLGTITSMTKGKLMKAQIRLSPVDLQTYTFDRPVRITSRLFEVLRINGKPAESDVYEVELRTIDYPDAAALSWLQNPNTPSYLTYDADPE